MAEDFYSEGGDTAVEETVVDDAAPDADTEEKPGAESSESETALVNDSFFPADCEVGKSYKITVVAQHDGEKEIAFQKAPKEKAMEMPDEDSMSSKIGRAAMME